MSLSLDRNNDQASKKTSLLSQQFNFNTCKTAFKITHIGCFDKKME